MTATRLCITLQIPSTIEILHFPDVQCQNKCYQQVSGIYKPIWKCRQNCDNSNNSLVLTGDFVTLISLHSGMLISSVCVAVNQQRLRRYDENFLSPNRTFFWSRDQTEGTVPWSTQGPVSDIFLFFVKIIFSGRYAGGQNQRDSQTNKNEMLINDG